MTYYTYKSRTLHHRKVNRRYRQLVLFLCMIITILVFLLLVTQPRPAQADEMVIETYQSIEIQSGDCLWDLAMEHKLPDMNTQEYITEIRRINHLRSDELVSGQYLILPVYTYEAFPSH